MADEKGNSGDWNSGHWNSGDWNSGDRNSGDWNSGHRNSGHGNSGHWNSGNWNSGDGNRGDRNSGRGNSGNWNSGHGNSGDLNTDTPPLRMFNKETAVKRTDFNYPRYFYFDLTHWVNDGSVCGGHLEVDTHHEAWRKSWNKATKEDRELTLKLPNFDNEIFKQISGIDVLAELKQDDKVEIIIEGEKKYISRKDALTLGLVKD